MLCVLPQIDPVLTSEKYPVLIIDELRLLLGNLRSQHDRVAVHLRHLPHGHCARAVYPGAAPQDLVLLKVVLRYIRRHACEAVSLAKMAAKAGCHEKKLSKVLKEPPEQTVFACMREERISHARQLLVQTGMSVMDGAEQAGFQNACHFTMAFRARFNITPSGFRRAIRAKRDVIQCF